jgi:hypothetical protein
VGCAGSARGTLGPCCQGFRPASDDEVEGRSTRGPGGIPLSQAVTKSYAEPLKQLVLFIHAIAVITFFLAAARIAAREDEEDPRRGASGREALGNLPSGTCLNHGFPIEPPEATHLGPSIPPCRLYRRHDARLEEFLCFRHLKNQ